MYMDTISFWNRNKSLIKEQHTTQQAVAAAIGMPLSTLKNWMSRETIPSLDYAIELASYFNVSIQYLVFGKEIDIPLKIKEAQISLKAANDKLREIRY